MDCVPFPAAGRGAGLGWAGRSDVATTADGWGLAWRLGGCRNGARFPANDLAIDSGDARLLSVRAMDVLVGQSPVVPSSDNVCALGVNRRVQFYQTLAWNTNRVDKATSELGDSESSLYLNRNTVLSWIHQTVGSAVCNSSRGSGSSWSTGIVSSLSSNRLDTYAVVVKSRRPICAGDAKEAPKRERRKRHCPLIEGMLECS